MRGSKAKARTKSRNEGLNLSESLGNLQQLQQKLSHSQESTYHRIECLRAVHDKKPGNWEPMVRFCASHLRSEVLPCTNATYGLNFPQVQAPSPGEFPHQTIHRRRLQVTSTQRLRGHKHNLAVANSARGIRARNNASNRQVCSLQYECRPSCPMQLPQTLARSDSFYTCAWIKCYSWCSINEQCGILRNTALKGWRVVTSKHCDGSISNENRERHPFTHRCGRNAHFAAERSI